MTAFRNIFLLALFAFIAFAVLYPNPYGNNPDIIGDESYFLTSALTAIEAHTLPGWVWSPSTTYYGGPQTYVDTIALVPVLGVVVASSHFSLTAAKVWLALNTGALVHVLRLVNGLTALGALAFCFLFFRKRKIPPALARVLTLFLFLLLGNVLVIEFLHTAKMWSYYIIFVAVSSAFFIAQEYYAKHLKTSFIKKERYAGFLVWSAVLTFFQSYVGAFSIFLLMLYALLLRHVSIADIWRHVRTYWYLIAAFSLTQISFLYQAYAIRQQFAGVATKTAQGAIDWLARVWTPFMFTIETQPLSLLYVLGISALIFLALYKRSFFADRRKRMYVGIALVHPLLVYLFFYVGIGFDLLPRYAILLTLACAFSAAILMSEIGKRAVQGALFLSVALFALVSAHAIVLYWHPSSESVLLDTIEARYNSQSNVFITDHSARRMTLPVNYASLALLDAKRQEMSRFAYLLQHRELLANNTTFKPLTLTAYTTEEEGAALAHLADGHHSVWIIRRLCTDRCIPKDIQAGTCFEIHMDACELAPQEVNTLRVFLEATQLGYSYIAHKIY